jgi:hypothetical protein
MVMAAGVARNRELGINVYYQAIQSWCGGPFPGFYRVWWVPGDYRNLMFGPEEFRNKYEKIQEYKHDPPVASAMPRWSLGQSDRLVLGQEVGPGVRQVHRASR